MLDALRERPGVDRLTVGAERWDVAADEPDQISTSRPVRPRVPVEDIALPRTLRQL